MNTSLLERRNDIFASGSALFYREPLHIVKGNGVELTDAEGNTYIDMYNNVPCVGHCHPHVVQSIQEQTALLNVHNRYLHESILEYGERLVAKHHQDVECVVFSCTGTEANEVALHMARAVTEGRGFICTDAAYHGNSAAVRQFSRPSDPRGDVRSIPFPETYRCNANDPTDYFLSALEDTIDSFDRDGVPFAGMLVCPILANEGLPNIPEGFMRGAQDLVATRGGVVIADEVQAGMCRTGEWWGYESEDFKPDIVSMGKPLGAGVPLAATAASRSTVELFRRKTRYFNTFASSPMQAAAGNAVLDVLENEQLREKSRRVGNWLRQELNEFLQDHHSVGQVRGRGLFVAIEWVRDRESKEPDRNGAVEIVELLKREKFLIGNAGKSGNVLKIRPPLVFTMDHASQFVDAFKSVIGA